MNIHTVTLDFHAVVRVVLQVKCLFQPKFSAMESTVVELLSFTTFENL